jgi:hypothetical protein
MTATISPVSTTAVSLGAMQPAAPAATTAVTAPAAGNAAVNTGYEPTPVVVSGGGAIADAIAGGISDISSMVGAASKRMDSIQQRMTAAMTASGGSLNPAALQSFHQEMTNAETAMQMLKQIQDKRDAANQIWARA